MLRFLLCFEARGDLLRSKNRSKSTQANRGSLGSGLCLAGVYICGFSRVCLRPVMARTASGLSLPRRCCGMASEPHARTHTLARMHAQRPAQGPGVAHPWFACAFPAGSHVVHDACHFPAWLRHHPSARGPTLPTQLTQPAQCRLRGPLRRRLLQPSSHKQMSPRLQVPRARRRRVHPDR